MKGNLKFTLLMVGIAVVFFIMGRELVETRVKLKNTRDEIAQEKKEKAWFRDELNTARTGLTRADRDLRAANSKLDFVNKKMLGLRHGNHKLASEKQGLEYKITLLQEEKRTMEARLHSLTELKKAIRQVKIDLRDDRISRRQEYIRQQKEIEKWETALGNRGFLTKDGEDYYKPKVNVEVRPASVSLNKK
ncbi:MAG: hypothetical protein KKB22_03430 [Candidatus Omnitrophica bacterium]|nr:hypothetical protein [Candidatus Omnitrophota bacterium]